MGARTRIGIVAFLPAVAAIAFAPSRAHAGSEAVVEYVAPAGSGTACSQSAPCDIQYGFANSSFGAQIVIMPGSYGSALDPITASLETNHKNLDLHGVAGQPLPVIYTSATDGVFLDSGSSISDVAIVSSGSYGLLTLDADVTTTRMVVQSTSNGGTACGTSSALTDSVCVASGTNGAAYTQAAGSEPPGIYTLAAALRNDTLIGTGSGSTAMSIRAGDSTAITIAVSNCIVRGAFSDIDAIAEKATSTVTVNVDHSDYENPVTEVDVTGGAASINGTNTVTAVPVFAGGAGSYREDPSSPTVNAGLATGIPATELDLDRNPRVIGKAPDIGAYELLQKPVVKKLKAHKVTGTSAHLTAKVNPEGLPTTLRLTAIRHGHAITSHTKPVGKGHHAKKRKITLHHLKPGTTYHVHARAKNDGGHAKAYKVKIHTKG